jgi:pimeloyl-ACP methyl ester carboxylesterase
MARPRLLKVLAAGLGVAAAALGVRALAQRAARARAFLPEGIDEKIWLPLGGLDQWVTIRGRDPEKPVLLVLHGGPGSSMTQLAHKAFPDWDRDFVVANWDQRGAGRTFGRHGAKGSGPLSIAGMAADGLALAEYLKAQFGRPIVLLGISWGSVLGVEMIRRRPDLFAAYVGAGQVVDMARGEALSYAETLVRLRAQGDERGARRLEGIAPPPYPDLKSLARQRKALISTMPKAERDVFRTLPLTLLLAPDGRLSDLADFLRGSRFSIGQLWDGLMGWKMLDGGGRFEVPILILQGDLDLQTPTALVTETIPRLQAPACELAILEGGGHLALVTHAEQFRRELVERTRPWTQPPKTRRRRPG